MSVITLSSLKGGVGKTSVAVNVAHALTFRQCEVLLIDLDPSAHASRFFVDVDTNPQKTTSGLRQLFEKYGTSNLQEAVDECVEDSLAECESLFVSARPSLTLLPAAPDLRGFCDAENEKHFRKYFSLLLSELQAYFDYIVIDTGADYSVLTQAGIENASILVAPVDMSAMSVDSLEELFLRTPKLSAAPQLIVRTMVAKQATKIQRIADSRLQKMIEAEGEPAGGRLCSLAKTRIFRSEVQSKLTHLNKTSFDYAEANPLAELYTNFARELELSGEEMAEDDVAVDALFSLSPAKSHLIDTR